MSVTSWTDRLRQHLLAGVADDIARLERELAAQRAVPPGPNLAADLARLEREVVAQRAALSNPNLLRPLIGSALGDAAAVSPEQIAAALRPIVEQLVRQRQAEVAARRRRVLCAVVAAVVVAAGSAALRVWWRPGAAVELSGAGPGGASRRPVGGQPVEAAPAAIPAAEADSVALEETDDGFGLGQSARSDVDLALAVRARLAARPELAGARLRFAVQEGWVWLRGEAGEASRRAAGDALADLGDDVVVVNQIVSHPAPDLVAQPLRRAE